MISLKQIFNAKEMSNKTAELNLQELSTLNLAFRNTKGHLCGLINVRKLNVKDRVQIIASDQIMEHLYLIENRIPGADLMITQKGASNAYSYFVKSGSKVPFAWDFPLKPKEIIVVPANPNQKMAESTFSFHDNCGTSIRDEAGRTILVEAKLEFVPTANLLLSFRACEKNKKAEGAEEIEVFDKGNKITVGCKAGDLMNKWYLQLQKVSISVIGQHNRRREETFRLIMDNVQVCTEDFGENVLWNFCIRDLGFYKYQAKGHELARFDIKKNQNNEPLGVNLVMLAEKNPGDIVILLR